MSKVIVSFDLECGWGAIENGLWQERQKAGVYKDLRDVLKTVSERLSEYEMSFTWAIVGALLQPKTDIDITHLNGTYLHKATEFIETADPQTIDGRDIFDILDNMRQPQKFACHSYSHVRFQDTEQTINGLKSELKKARNVNQDLGINADALVFPVNELGQLKMVEEFGFRKVRTSPAWGNATSGRKPLIQRAWQAYHMPPAAITERVLDTGLILHSGTELLNWGAGAGAIKRYITKRRIDNALHLASSNQGDVHFWLHPFNLVDTPGLCDYFFDFLNRLVLLRDNGKITTASF